jgi:hypothetical protein
MIIKKRVSSVIALLGFCCAFGPLGNGALAQTNQTRHHNPPPEAYTACEGASVGDTAEFETPDGDIVTGTCVEAGDQLVLRPDSLPEDRDQRGPHGPPPEAYSACEGKDTGDIAELETPEGDTVTGTCVEEDGRLVLLPDNLPDDQGAPSDEG